jgi:hypothetical protein
MSRELFETRKFQAKTFALIERANAIIGDYMARGFVLTLRQLFYQFVARALIANTQSEYKRLGSIIVDARRAGMIDWSAIEDRTRSLRKSASWDGPEDIVAAVAQQYREDLWRDQDCYVECWIEKDALLGVVEDVCDDFRPISPVAVTTASRNNTRPESASQPPVRPAEHRSSCTLATTTRMAST